MIDPAVAQYLRRLTDLRAGASWKSRDTYTCAIGQLLACGLIPEPAWRSALDAPRTEWAIKRWGATR